MGLSVKLRNDLSRIHQHVGPSSRPIATALRAVELMTIVLEDRRFFRHAGIDAQSIARETIRAFTWRKFGGASTIDMQFVRTATGYKKNTMGRKLYELFLAKVIQSRYGKLEILRSYLACAFFGSGLIGADMAAQKMFGKNAEELGLEEASLIAAMLACPRPLNGSPGWELKVRRRAAYGMKVYGSRRQSFTGPYELASVE